MKLLPRNAPGTTEQIIQAMCDVKAGAEIVDVGFGEGFLLQVLHDMGFTNLYGYERPIMFKGRKLEDYKDISWKEKPLDLNDRTHRKNAFAYKKNRWDVIICSEVLEHVYAPFECIKDFLHSLKKNGKLIITFPNAFSIWSRARRDHVGTFRWFERDEEYPEEVKASFDELTGHINPIDPICVANFVNRWYGDTVRLTKIDGNNFYREALEYGSGWVDDPKEGDYWNQLFLHTTRFTKTFLERMKEVDKTDLEQMSHYADCILMKFTRIK